MYLDEIFKKAPHFEIKQLSCDSRMPMNDAIFFCLDGPFYDGHDFYKEAIKNGAKVIIYESQIDTNFNAIFIKVKNVTNVLIKIAKIFYSNPTSNLTSYVVSGCYGKTITTYIIDKLLNCFEKSAYISQRGIYDGNDYRTTSFRTLSIIETLKVARKMVKMGVKSAIFESSVQSLSYKKMDVVDADCFIYTTTGVESSEYKELNREYQEELFSYLSRLDSKTKLIINRDDILFDSLSRNSENTYISYGTNVDSDFRITSVQLLPNETKFSIVVNNNKYNISTKLLGFSNVYNLTAAICALSLRYSIDEIIKHIDIVEQIDGCFYSVNEGQNYKVIIDGASNYETIKYVYQYAKAITPDDKRIISVLPINYLDNSTMLQEIMNLSEDTVDLLVITAGDTYGKDLTPLIEEARSYIQKRKYVIIEDRETAISVSIDNANSDDTVLLLGKGEEKYIYHVLGKSSYAGDKKVATNAIRRRENEAF